jgi:hypothetical protein
MSASHAGNALSRDMGSALRHALEQGDFEAAERLAVEYGDSVLASVRANTDPASRQAVLGNALETLNECLHLTRVLRAHLATQVRDNSAVCQYQPPEGQRRAWQFDA